MAPREEEIFTDLQGRPDEASATPAAGQDDASLLEQDLLKVATGKDKSDIEDDDVQVHAEEDEDLDPLAAAAAAADEDEEEEEAEDEPNGDPSFDPKDVALVIKDAEVLDLRETTAKDAETRAKQDIEDAKKAMEVAQGAGETKDNIAATERYTAATIALRDAQDRLTQVGREKENLKGRAASLYAKAPRDAQGNPVLDGSIRPGGKAAPAKGTEAPSKLTPSFKKLNPWFGNKKYEKQTKTLIALDRGLGAEGRIDKNSPAYFTELLSRFSKEHPGLAKNLDGKPIATGTRQRRAGAPIPAESGGGGGERQQQQQNGAQVKFTNTDLTEMAKFGMDPNNMEHRKTWLREKRSLAGKAA